MPEIMRLHFVEWEHFISVCFLSVTLTLTQPRGKKQPQKVSHRAMMKALLEGSLIRSVPIFRTDQATLKSILFSLFCARWSILSTGSSLKSHKVSKQCHYESSLLLVKPSFKKKHKRKNINLTYPFLPWTKKQTIRFLNRAHRPILFLLLLWNRMTQLLLCIEKHA